MKQTTITRYIALSLAIMLGGGLIYYYRHTILPQSISHVVEQGPIYTYDELRDTDAMVAIFKNDWYWLSNRDYSEERIRAHLHSHSPNEFEPRYFGAMTIKVLREGDNLIGFITYYMKNFNEGFILYLAVDANFRGKRYGEQLLNYAVNDLKGKGATKVSLTTRVGCANAIKLYLRAGFILSPDGDFVRLEKDI